MDNLEHRVAKAICHARHGPDTWRLLNEVERNDFLYQARMSIAAVREWDKEQASAAATVPADYGEFSIGKATMTQSEELKLSAESIEKRSQLIDWLNAFKADPFSTGADKVDRLLEIVAPPPPSEPLVERALPCDVKLPPATVIKAGCKLETLIAAMSLEGRPTHFAALPAPADDVERLEAEVLARIDADEAAMIAERKAQYGERFNGEQLAAIEGIHRRYRIGVKKMSAALAKVRP